MAVSEKNALGRVLLVAKEAYAAAGNGDGIANVVAMLDSISAILSHIGDEKKPISKLLRVFKREIKSKNKAFYKRVRKFFSFTYPVLDYDFDKAAKHIPAIIHGNDKICLKAVARENSRVASMCDAMKSYPGFLFGEYEALSDKQFYDLVFGYYPKIYDEDFMSEMKPLFDSGSTDES